jgi:hypothetical protein
MMATNLNTPAGRVDKSDAITEPATPRAPTRFQTFEFFIGALASLGLGRLCPESITAFRREIEDWGWKGTAQKACVDPQALREAYDDTMEQLRRMFEPVDGSDE